MLRAASRTLMALLRRDPAMIAGLRFSATRLQERRDALMTSGGRVALGENVRWGRDEMLHPYVGYVPGPGGGDAANLLGAAPTALPRRRANHVVVAVVGGSVAHLFAEQGLPRLIERLSGLDAYRGRTFIPLNLAVGGYKQPQAFMTIADLLALGAEFDVVVNLDGFNDVTVHPAENAAHGVPPAYPRRWDQRVEGLLQGGTLRLALQRVLVEQRRARLAYAFSRSPWRVLNTTNLIYLALDRRLEAQQAAVDRQFLSARDTSASPAAGADLQGRCVRFADLSRAFRNHPKPIYVDSCCHVNARGSAILADLMFEATRRDPAPVARGRSSVGRLD